MITRETNNIVTYNIWCQNFKVSSRLEKYKTMWHYRPGEYDCNKFIKMMQSYEKKRSNQKEKITIWDKIRKTLHSLRLWEM